MIISLDCETTGLSEFKHEAWEIGYAALDGSVRRCWQLPLRRPRAADKRALEIGQFARRYQYNTEGRAVETQSGEDFWPWTVASSIAADLTDATILGAAVQFDLRFVAEFLRSHLGDSRSRPWHHRALDLGSYVAGLERSPEPLSTSAMADIVPNEVAHTALGDALWNIEVYEHYRGRS